MNIPRIIKHIAKVAGIPEVDFSQDVIVVDAGSGPYIAEWKLDIPRPSLAELAAAEAAAEAEAAAVAYIDQRRLAYPPIGEQLDMLFHDMVDGTNKFRDAIAAIKAQFPKG